MDEQQRAARIRALLKGLTRRGRGRRYPDELRRLGVAQVAVRRAAGVTLRGAARDMDLPWRTVEHWARGAPTATAALRPVTVMPVATRPVVVVHGPRGLRVEGLDVVQLAELWARLG